MDKDEIKIEDVSSRDEVEDYKLKVIIVGGSGVGKSNLEKLWLLVAKHLSENEVDELLTRLKNIWRKEHE